MQFCRFISEKISSSYIYFFFYNLNVSIFKFCRVNLTENDFLDEIRDFFCEETQKLCIDVQDIFH